MVNRKVAFALAAVVIFSFIGLEIADTSIGLLLRRQMNLIFPANTTVTHETAEFRYTAHINSMGFRDHEVAPKVPGRRRVLVFGDSFVYGWGVEVEQAWPKVLEAELKAAGEPVEVFDLGVPGGGPTEYAEIAKRAIPVLQPDLVLVGVLEGDDLMQEGIKLETPPTPPARISLRHRVAEAVFPNIVSLMIGQAHLSGGAVPESAMRGTYRAQVAQMLTTLSPEQRERLNHIDRDAYQMWENGDLNPYVVLSAMKTPGYFVFTLHPEQPAVAAAVKRMADALRTIKAEADKVGATEVVVAEPYPAYVMADGFVRKFGFDLPADANTATGPDDVIASASQMAHVQFASVLERFRHAEHQEDLFYRFDGHPTVAGQRLLAEGVASAVFHAPHVGN
jgi:lysophospholipase L1-like esterase